MWTSSTAHPPEITSASAPPPSGSSTDAAAMANPGRTRLPPARMRWLATSVRKSPSAATTRSSSSSTLRRSSGIEGSSESGELATPRG